MPSKHLSAPSVTKQMIQNKTSINVKTNLIDCCLYFVDINTGISPPETFGSHFIKLCRLFQKAGLEVLLIHISSFDPQHSNIDIRLAFLMESLSMLDTAIACQA